VRFFLKIFIINNLIILDLFYVILVLSQVIVTVSKVREKNAIFNCL